MVNVAENKSVACLISKDVLKGGGGEKRLKRKEVYLRSAAPGSRVESGGGEKGADFFSGYLF